MLVRNDPVLMHSVHEKQCLMFQHHLNSLSTYRSPQPLCRPSPQTSPGLIVQVSNKYNIETCCKGKEI
jgi:hypothetical protein